MENKLGEWNKNLLEAKIFALKNDRPLIVMACAIKSCSYCKGVEANIFTQESWKNYCKLKGISQYRADSGEKESFRVLRAITPEFRVTAFPFVIILDVKDTADLTSDKLDKKKNVDLIGKFIYRPNRSYNGIKITPYSVEKSTDNFIQVLESFYKESHPEWLKDM